MVINIRDLVNVLDLQLEVSLGYVTERTHPEDPDLVILNYSDTAQFDNRWNEITEQCRGLIYNRRTGRVLARPFRKMFNWDQQQAPSIGWDQPLYTWGNKWDGSLGIGYFFGSEVRIATRGSFDSEQARHANKYLRANPEVAEEIANHLIQGFTPLFEIIYPKNRIVVDYGKMDELVPLGRVSIEHGYYVPEELQPTRRFSELQADLDRPNSEGWVAWKNEYQAVKIKQADYLELHRIVSSLSEKEVWRQLRAGTYREFAAKLPDEFHGWVKERETALQNQFDLIKSHAVAAYGDVLRRNFETRKEQALYLASHYPPEQRGLVFSLLDGRNPDDAIWKRLEPVGRTGWVGGGE